MGSLTFINHTEWYKENYFIIACMTGYSFLFSLYTLYISLLYVKKLFVEIPLLFLTISSLTTCVLGLEAYEESFVFDLAYMSLMIVTLILMAYIKVTDEIRCKNNYLNKILNYIYKRSYY